MRPNLALTLLLTACARGPGEVVLTPDHGPMSGYYGVRVDLSASDVDPAAVRGATLGGVAAFDLVVDGDAIAMTVHGAPTAGPAALSLDLGTETVAFDAAFTFDPPIDPLFDRFMAIGASLTEGVQGGVPTRHAQLNGPAAFVARQAGAWFALPLLVEGLFPTIDPEDVGPPPECAIPDIVQFVASAAVDVLAQINDVENDRLDFSLALATPGLAPSNVAVGGSNVATLLNGPGDNFEQTFLAKLVYQPGADVLDPVWTSQIDLAEAASPTLIVCADTYGNDLITAVVESKDIDPDKLTPPEDLRADLEEAVERLASTGAEVYLANIPRASLLPATEEKVRATLAEARRVAEQAGNDPDAAEADALAAIEGRIAEVEAMGETYRAILDEVAGAWPNVHVVDFAGLVETVETESLMVGGVAFDVRKFGGLLSTDGVHFSDTGYAMVANLVLDTIAETTGVDVPRVDLVPVAAGDPYSPDNLRAAGLDVDACLR